MNNFKLISVLLPLYNEPKNIAQEAISSICNQTYKNLEILLLLDNPQNYILKKMMQELAQRDSRIKCIFNEKNLGLPQTLNKGIDLATGEYIARMDADDISLPTRFETQVNFLQKHPEIDLLGCDAVIIDDTGKEIGYYSKLRTNWGNRILIKYCCSNLIHPTWMGPSHTFKECKYRNFLSAQDYDFALRAYALGFHFYNLKEPLLKYRIPQQSLRSISCKKAYEQYINAILARKQFKEFLHSGHYPQLPKFEYDQNDKEKYLSTIPLLNQLREYTFRHQYKNIIKCLLAITKTDSRPIKSRIKSHFFKAILAFIEKSLPIKK